MTHRNRLLRSSAVLGSIGLLGLGGALAQDDQELDRTPEDCVIVSTISRTEVVDDRTILFFMRGKKVYRNYLPRTCPGLQREERFMYTANGNRLCAIDTITVLQLDGIGGLNPGFTCRLGDFHPITRDEVEALRIEKENGGSLNPNTIRVQPAQAPPEDKDEPAEAPPPAEPTQPEDND